MKVITELREAFATLINAQVWEYDEPFTATTDYVPIKDLKSDELFVSVLPGTSTTREGSPRQRQKWDRSITVQIAKTARRADRFQIDHVVDFAEQVVEFCADQSNESVTKSIQLPCGITLRRMEVELIPVDPNNIEKTVVSNITVSFMEV